MYLNSFYTFMRELHTRLTKRGWSEQDIHTALNIVRESESKKSNFIRALDRFVSWLFLIIAVLGSFIISAILVPLLIVMQGIFLYVVLFIAGLFFGTIILSVLVHLRHIKTFITPYFFIPLIALLNTYIITLFSNDLIKTLQLHTLEHSPALVTFVYLIAFLLPQLFSRVHSLSVVHTRK